MFVIKYVIADIHGEFDKFLEMLDLIEFGDTDQLFILGDIIDRGPKSLELIEFCMENEDNIELLLGNHEDLMLMYYEGKIEAFLWFINGGKVTYESFEGLSLTKKLDILNFLDSRSLGKIVDNFVLVHAGISPSEKSLPVREALAQQSKEDLLWIREDFINYPTGLDDHVVIFGHTPVSSICEIRQEEMNEPYAIWHDDIYARDKIGIDCGVVRKSEGGHLGVLRLDDMKEFYV